ncbi:helix-turn-helix domain-containing protein [Bacillus sp. V5-8f]|nr:hypothetical protein CUU64_21665 [Bacillus sp. V5-8f]
MEQCEEKISDREYIIYIFHKTNGNRAKAAKELGISRSALYRKIQKYNIS